MAENLDPSDLLKAACSGDVEEVMKLLSESSADSSESKDIRAACLNIRDKSGMTALCLAAREDHVVAIKTLVHAGADINLPSSNGNQTPLMHALEWNNVPCIRELILLGADVNCKDNWHWKGQTVLHAAAVKTRLDEEILQLLIKACADLDCVTDKEGLTPLVEATIAGNEKYLRLLIEAGADVNATAKKRYFSYGVLKPRGSSALMHAAKYHRLECLKLLLQAGADVNFQSSDKETALHWAVRNNSSNYMDNTSWPDITYAECVKSLVDCGANVNLKTSFGETALILAVKEALTKRNNDWRVKKTFTKRNNEKIVFSRVIKVVKFLINSGAHAGQSCRRGQTVLMYAARNDQLISLLPILVKAGAVINQQDANKMTALAYAVITKSRECVRWLVDSGACVNICDNPGKTPLAHAACNGSYEYISLLVDSEASVNICDNSGKTPLAHAACNGSYECISLLVDSGASVNICDDSGKTPLHHLMNSNGFLDQRLSVILGKRPDVNATDTNGMTPLMYAAQKSHGSGTMGMLIKHGANLNILDNEGQTALIHCIMASDRVRTQNAKLLLAKGANFDKGELASGRLSTVTDLERDLDLTKLRVGNKVDLEVSWYHFSSVIGKDHRKILLFLIINKVMPLGLESTFKCLRYNDSPQCAESVLEAAVKSGRHGIMKFLIAICYLRSDDLTLSCARSRSERDQAKPINSEVAQILENLRSQPWPLVKLCFVAVSTAFGASPGRQKRVENSQLPPKLQNMLLFQEPWSRLCVRQWGMIPLTFSPDNYEKLPQPRPLLYHWPVGRALVPCDCGKCDGTMYKIDDSGTE